MVGRGTCQCCGARALDVVVEAQVFMSVLLQYCGRVNRGEVLCPRQENDTAQQTNEIKNDDNTQLLGDETV